MVKKIGTLAFGIALMLVLGGCDAKQKAKEQLEQKGITYSQESFAKAIGSNNKDVVELFFNAGIDLNNPEILEAIVSSDDMTIIKKALEKGLNPNVKANGVPLIVMLSSDKKNNPKLKDLLEDKNTNINLQVEKSHKNFQETSNALAEAVANNNVSGFEMLIKKGADTKMDFTIKEEEEVMKMNITGLLLLASEDNSETDILSMLKMIPNLDVNSKVNIGQVQMNLLHIASLFNKVELVRFLLDKGANFNAITTPVKITPLMITYNTQNIDLKKADIIEKLLISKGANRFAKDVNSHTFEVYKAQHIQPEYIEGD